MVHLLCISPAHAQVPCQVSGGSKMKLANQIFLMTSAVHDLAGQF
jgi:hypothetical protein